MGDVRIAFVGVVAVALAQGCGGGGGAPSGPAPPGVVRWPVGEYELVADLDYGRRRVTHRATLAVAEGGELTLVSSTGICLPDPRERMNRGNRRRSFVCGDAVFALEPFGGIVRGEVSVRAEITVQGARECVRYETTRTGAQVCTQWTQPLETRMTTLTEKLRVTAKEGATP